jgi:PAS domain S-box-containing protein
LRRFLDDGLDELAAIAHQGAPLRLLITGAVTWLCLGLAAPALCWSWFATVVALELWSYVITRRQARGETASTVERVQHVIALAVISSAWMAMGAALWAAGSAAGAVCAVMLWLSVIFFAQTFGYQSPMALAAGGVLPGLILVAVLAFGPDPLGLRLTAVSGMFATTALFAVDGVRRMVRARRRFDEARARLQESEAKYRLLADNLSDVVSLFDLDGDRGYLSPSIERALGYTVEEMAQGGVYDRLHPEDAAWLPQEIRKMVHGCGEGTFQYRTFHKDGHVVWMETTFTLVENGYAEASRQLVSVSRVIDARKALETELIEARRRAEEAAAAKADFLANMTHELRTPLNAIVGFAGVLKASNALNARDSRHAHLIGEASDALLELVNSVLDFSRLEAGAVQVEARPFDPAEPARAMCALLTAQAEAKGLALTLKTEGEIAPLLGDAARIRQVLLNFLSNALKFTEAGEITVTVAQAEAPSDCGRLRIAVADTGIGLREDQIEHLFDRFTQADATVSRKYGGTGLGLAICKRTVELMGGTIGVTSEPGEGSVFWFELTLPRTDEHPAAAAGQAEAPEDFDQPLRLLVVEDVAVNRELITALLAPFSLEIEMAENGEQAIAAMCRASFDLVLMDVQMPVMDGLTAARAIRGLPDPAARATPIVAMTANVLPDQVETCRQAGMDDHLGKPISPARLLETLAYWSTHRRGDAPMAPERLSA